MTSGPSKRMSDRIRTPPTGKGGGDGFGLNRRERTNELSDDIFRLRSGMGLLLSFLFSSSLNLSVLMQYVIFSFIQL